MKEDSDAEAEQAAGIIIVPVVVAVIAAAAALATMARVAQGFDRVATGALPDVGAPGIAVRSMGDAEAKARLAAAGVPVLPEGVAATAEEAAEMAAEMGFPVVLKIVSPQIAHKTEVGGVALNLADADAVRAEAARMLAEMEA